MASTRHLTILLTDIKGFTDKTSHQTRAQIVDMLERHKAVVQPVLEGRGGRLVKTIGDAYLMAYDSPTDAVLAGVAVQDALRRHNLGRPPEERIEVRIAINCGEVTLADNDVFGEPVNITARIESVAEAGEVFFTEAVYLSMNKAEVPSAEVGLLQLKGIPEKIRVYKVKRETPLGQGAVPQPSGTGLREPEPKAVYAASSAPSLLDAAAAPVVGPAKGVAGAAMAVASAAARAASIDPARPLGGAALKVPVWRRGAAVLIDAILCSLLAGMLFPGRDWTRHHRPERPAASAADGAMSAKSAKVDISVLHGVHVDGPNGKVDIDPSKGQVNVQPAKAAAAADGARGDSRDDDRDRGDGRPWDFRRWGFSLVWFVYMLLCLKRFGTTVGGRVMKLAVVRVDGKPLEKGDRLMRAGMSLVSGWAAGLGYFWALWDKEGRGWHDLMANTRVVSVER